MHVTDGNGPPCRGACAPELAAYRYVVRAVIPAASQHGRSKSQALRRVPRDRLHLPLATLCRPVTLPHPRGPLCRGHEDTPASGLLHVLPIPAHPSLGSLSRAPLTTPSRRAAPLAALPCHVCPLTLLSVLLSPAPPTKVGSLSALFASEPQHPALQ